MPKRENEYLPVVGNVVDVVPGPLQQHTPRPRDRRWTIRTTDKRCLTDHLEGDGEFVEEEIGGCRSILSPPIVDYADLGIGFRCRGDRQAHRRRRNSSRIADAGRRRPASADVQDADRLSCKARRSSSVRSSPSSSATSSMTVPSGSVVGSSRTKRPFSTRARRGFMALLYGLRARTGKYSRPGGVPLLRGFRRPAQRIKATGSQWGRQPYYLRVTGSRWFVYT
jgi:hypothetical protein